MKITIEYEGQVWLFEPEEEFIVDMTFYEAGYDGPYHQCQPFMKNGKLPKAVLTYNAFPGAVEGKRIK